jgi:exopolysaccharide production protein ExoZ
MADSVSNQGEALQHGAGLGSAEIRVAALDALRGLAVLMVVVFHVALHIRPGGILGWVASSGYLGVQLFYLISAYTMCHMWLQRTGESLPAAKFYLRRFTRIAPPFWVALGVYALWRALGWRGPVQADWGDWLLTAGFLNAFSPHAINLLVPGGWSVAVEMFFYLCFPWLTGRLPDAASRLWAAVVALVVGAVLQVLWLRTSHADLQEVLYYSPLTQFPVFLFGMALYQAITRQGVLPSARRVLWILGLGLVTAVVLRAMSGLGRPLFWMQVWGLAAMMWWLMTRLRWVPLIKLGRMSYSIYLFHLAVLDLLLVSWPVGRMQGPENYLLALGLVMCGTCAVAWVSARTLERWSMALGRRAVRLLERRESRSVASA